MTAREIKHYTGPLLEGPRCVLKKWSDGYPQALRDLDNPPDELFIIGNVEVLRGGISIVGARKATPYGTSCAKRFATLASNRGIITVSGGALGCDSACHEASVALKRPTVVVLGGGCDEVYPARNYKLFQSVIDAGGAVISEHDWNFPALGYTFRARNRIIAALSKATLIVEAGMPSGTFSTADEALHLGREVLVVPGSITSPSSLGSNRLLYQGALPVVDDASFTDILSSLYPNHAACLDIGGSSLTSASVGGAVSLCEDPLIAAMLAEPLNAEEIYALSKSHCAGDNPVSWSEKRIEVALEAGLISRYADGRYGAQV